MLDQSFSIENFKKVIEVENRKGVYLDGKFLPAIKDIDKRIKLCNVELKALKRANLTKQEYFSQREAIIVNKDLQKEEKENRYREELTKLIDIVHDKSYSLNIIRGVSVDNKPTYKIDDKLEDILVLKQLQYNFRKLYKVKQANRYSIVSQLKNLLDDNFPKIVVRTDIRSFYESIPHDVLLRKLSDEGLLTYMSKKLISQILNKYHDLTGEKLGVPRGIGINNEAVKHYKKLSPRKQLFIDQVILHGNQTAAYQTAYPNCTAAAAKSSASRLMADPVIAACITKGRNKARVMVAEFLRQRCLAKFADISEKRAVLTRIIRGDIMIEKEVIDKFGEKQVVKVKPDLDERIRAINADEKLEAKWERQLPQLMNIFNILDDPYQTLEDFDALD